MNIFDLKQSPGHKTGFALLLAALVALIITPTVLAHTILLRSDPADNAILAQPPAEVHLWFSEAISPHFSGAQILDISGRPVEGVRIRVNPAENLLILTPPKLPEGLYSVRWKILSEADGHFSQGLLVFGVGEHVNLSSAAPAQIETPLPLPEMGLRWLNFTTLLILVGSVLMAYTVLQAAPTPSGAHEAAVNALRRSAQRRVLVVALSCNGLGLLVGIALLGWQISVLFNTLAAGASPFEVGWQLVGHTRWGWFWLLRQSVLLALLPLLFRLLYRLPRPTLIWLATSLLLLTLLLIQALMSHAAAVTVNIPLAVGVDMLHLLAASLWAGGLLALVAGLLPLQYRTRADFVELARATWAPFSRLAALSVGMLVATGLYNTGRQVASLDALLSTFYGQALLGKVALMLAVGAFGLFNASVLHPGLAGLLARWLHRPSGWTPLSPRRLPAVLLAEAGLGLLVLLVTGLLTATPPARGAEFEIAAEDIPAFVDQMADDMLVTFSAKPNRPGQNVFTIRTASTRRPAPAEVMRVMVRFTYLEQELGHTSVDAVEIEPGLYQVGGNNLSLAGAWQVQVVVRRRGIEDTVAQFNWILGPPGPARPVIISKRALETPLTVAAGVISLILGLIIGGWWWRKQGARWNTTTTKKLEFTQFMNQN